MRDDRWRAVEPHLDQILDLDESERSAELDRLRAVDADLAADVHRLLVLGREADRERFLEDAPVTPEVAASLAGQTLGAYTLIEPIGQGGMGSVWLARRSDGRFEGKVALKLLNASLVGRAGEERFRREGSILARLSHPNIARLLDAGVSVSGQPYLVLEHVDGERIDLYCDRLRLPTEARVKLLLEVAGGLSQAHANLVVHRDIKPSNVLVAIDGRVKLLDFGIAKLLEDGGAGVETALTRDGGRAFTPEFAAPEQLTGGAVTTATDVHALGTLAYLLLAGGHPAGGAHSSPAQLMKAIVDTDPRRPSESVKQNDASARSTTVEGLRRQLRGDLDTIVTKALKKNPAERYASVAAMAEDLRRFLTHEPIAARPDTFGYRAAKFIRRHRAGVVLGSLAVLAVLAGTLATFWQAREARKQRDAAVAQLARSTASSEFLTFLFSVAAPAGQKFVAADLLDEGERAVEKQFPAADPLKAELLANIGAQHLAAQRFGKALPVLERAEMVAKESADPALRARVRCTLAKALLVDRQKERADRLIAGSLADLPDDAQHALLRAGCLTRWAEFGYYTDEGELMVSRASEALTVLADAPVPSFLTRLEAESALAYGYYLTRQNAKADAAFAALTKELERVGQDRTMAAADAWNNWGLMYHRGEIRRAEPLYRRSLDLHRAIEGEGSVDAVTLHNYAGVLQQLGRYEEAEGVFREAIASARSREVTYIEIFATLELSTLYAETGRLDAARSEIATLDKYVGTNAFTPLRRAFLAYARGTLAAARGDSGEARVHFADSVRLYDGIPAKFSHGVLALTGLARAELATGHPEAAEAAARRALVLAESFVDKDAPSYLVGLSLASLGEVERSAGKISARETIAKAVQHLEKTLGPDHPATRQARREIS